MSNYGRIKLYDGPAKNALIPTLGAPVYGFCLQVERPSRWLRRPQTHIYRIDGVRGMYGDGHYVGTLR